jgi:TolB-like protein/Flp pilus assembly protein TadD
MTPDSAKQATSTSDIFVSYASADAAVANSIVEMLEQHGLKCWLAPRDVKPGTQYADAIVRAINESKAVVLVLSGNAVASDHVAREVERAASKHKQIIAFRIDAAALNPALEYFLSNSQWIDVPALGMPAALAKLAEAVGSGSATSVHETPVTHRGDGKPKRFAIVAAILLCVAAAAALGLHFWSLSHSAAQQAAPVSDKSIAVLPFTDMSEKHDQEYFGDGMAEEILDLLVKIPGLTVIGRTSSFQFKGKNEDLRTIGTKLNAAYVLEGSVRKSGDQVRITAQLINTRTGAHEWSETYDRHIDDVLKLQDAIAAAVVRELQLTVASGYLNSRSTLKNVEAYDLYLRGRHAADRWDQEGLEEAVTLFQQALDRDPTSADAAAELAAAYEGQGEDGFLKPPAAAFEQARRETATALKLDPKNARVHYVLGLIHVTYDWDWAAAEREFQQATTLAPGSAYALCGEAVLSLALGRWDDALRQIKASLAQDPLDTGCIDLLSQIQVRRGHLPEAEAAWRRVLEIRPTYGFGHYYLGLVLLARGDRDAALREMQQETSDLGKQQGLAIVYYALGRKAESDTALAWLLKEHAQTEAFLIAEVYASRGQPDEAMHWLERAYAQKDVNLLYIKGDPLLKSLEADPRYIEFLRKMNLPE